jgi:hypothetical protein
MLILNLFDKLQKCTLNLASFDTHYEVIHKCFCSNDSLRVFLRTL